MIWLALPSLLGCSSAEPFGLVVLTAGGIEPTQDAAIAERVGEGLGKYGFDVTVQPTPVTGTDLVAEARGAARTARATHAVLLDLRSRQERPGVVDKTHLQAVKLTAHVVHTDEARPVPSWTAEFATEDINVAPVQRRVADTWVKAGVPWAVSRLYDTPEVQAAIAGEVDMSQLAAASAIEEHHKKVWLRTEREKDYQTFCDDDRKRLETFAESDGVRCFGDPCGQSTLIGVDANDRAIVQDISRVPWFAIPPRTAKRGWIEPPERVYAVPLADPSAPRTLLRSGNLYGFGNTGPGADHGVVELFSSEGNGAIYGFAHADGARAALAHLARGEETRYSRVAPDGSALFFCISGETECIWWEHARRPQRWFRTAAVLALPEGNRIVGQLMTGELAIDDPHAEEHAPGLPFEHTVTRVLGVHDGTIQLMARDGYGNCALERLDPGTMKLVETLPLPHCIKGPSLVADGRIVGTATVSSPGDIPGDDEIVVWEPGTELAIPLTSGPFREEYAYTTRDGTQVVFNRRLEEPPEEFDTQLYRRVVCATDLP